MFISSIVHPAAVPQSVVSFERPLHYRQQPQLHINVRICARVKDDVGDAVRCGEFVRLLRMSHSAKMGSLPKSQDLVVNPQTGHMNVVV